MGGKKLVKPFHKNYMRARLLYKPLFKRRVSTTDPPSEIKNDQNIFFGYHKREREIERFLAAYSLGC